MVLQHCSSNFGSFSQSFFPIYLLLVKSKLKIKKSIYWNLFFISKSLLWKGVFDNNEYTVCLYEYALANYACFLLQDYAMHVLKWKQKKRLFVSSKVFVCECALLHLKRKQNYFHKNWEIQLSLLVIIQIDFICYFLKLGSSIAF